MPSYKPLHRTPTIVITNMHELPSADTGLRPFRIFVQTMSDIRDSLGGYKAPTELIVSIEKRSETAEL